jgi:hypothetical protein
MIEISSNDMIFSIGIFQKMKFQNYYLSISSNRYLLKPSWTLRGAFDLGEICKSKEKHLKHGEKISNLENASRNLINIPLTICKRLWKDFSKRICKNKTSGANLVQNVK